jgi:DNA-binding transcriptional regulator YdaS (Cro superfamily)
MLIAQWLTRDTAILYICFMTNEAIKRAIDAKGSGAAFAASIGRSPQFVSQLLKGWRAVPAELCLVIERETGVRCEDLRPDVEWGVLRSKSRRAPAKAA